MFNKIDQFVNSSFAKRFAINSVVGMIATTYIAVTSETKTEALIKSAFVLLPSMIAANAICEKLDC